MVSSNIHHFMTFLAGKGGNEHRQRTSPAMGHDSGSKSVAIMDSEHFFSTDLGALSRCSESTTGLLKIMSQWSRLKKFQFSFL